MSNVESLVGFGLYSVPEASRLLKVNSQTIRRWVCGYEYNIDKKKKKINSLLNRDIEDINDKVVLSFLDLIEVKIVNEFRKYGLTLFTIKEAARIASQIYNDKHPFSLKKFKTDGKRVFAELENNNLIDLNKKHYVFNEIVSPSLFASFEFDEDGQVKNWRPEFGKGKVVLDPHRSFGRPILYKEGIATDIIANSVKVEGSIQETAKWYNISIDAVRAAVEFEQELAA